MQYAVWVLTRPNGAPDFATYKRRVSAHSSEKQAKNAIEKGSVVDGCIAVEYVPREYVKELEENLRFLEDRLLELGGFDSD